ncbi:MAG: PhoH family protein [Nanobdellota archaeon]
MAMQNSSFIYLLTGNLHKVPEYQDAVQQNQLSGDLFSRFKKPHDLLLPHKVLRELDHIKGNPRKQPEEQARALRAQETINRFLACSDLYQQGAGSREVATQIRQGKKPLVLDNGANVYFMDVTKSDVEKILDDSWDAPNDDQVILSTILKFLDQHECYDNVRFITDDMGARNDSALYGLKSDPFRFGEVRNPLQSNPGIYEVEVNLTHGRKLLSEEDVAVNAPCCGLNFDESFFSPNNVLEISISDGRKREAESPITEYRVFDPKSKRLRQLSFYQEFMNFFASRMYIATEKKEEAVGKIEYNPNLIGNIEHLSNTVEALYEQELIQEAEYHNRMNMIESNKNSSKKKSNQGKKVKQAFAEFERRELIVPSGGGRPDSQKYEDMLELPFNNYLYPQGQQRPYLDHLLNPDIRVLSVDAKGGFGKTLWALAAGLFQVYQGTYEKILYLGSLATAEGDIGYRRGDKAAKIHDKIQPAKRALREIFTDFSKQHPEHRNKVEDFASGLENFGVVEYDVIVDIKGSTYLNTFGIVDEAHLYTLDEAGLILGRFGHGSKVVALSAMEQLRSSTKVGRLLNERTAGVSHMAEKLPAFNEYAHISVSADEIYRGIIPKMAAELTKMRLG